MRTSCCVNLPPPPSSHALHASHPTRPSQVSFSVKTQPRVKDEGCCRRQRVAMGVACTIIGLDMANLVRGAQVEAVAEEMPLAAASISKENVAKWSEKRACPSWRQNSLETIVPENLPRPAARRRYEAVGHANSKVAPPVSVAVKSEGNCFSM